MVCWTRLHVCFTCKQTIKHKTARGHLKVPKCYHTNCTTGKENILSFRGETKGEAKGEAKSEITRESKVEKRKRIWTLQRVCDFETSFVGTYNDLKSARFVCEQLNIISKKLHAKQTDRIRSPLETYTIVNILIGGAEKNIERIRRNVERLGSDMYCTYPIRFNPI